MAGIKDYASVRVLWTISLEYWLRRLGRTRAFGPAKHLVLDLQAATGADKRLATTSNGIPSCDMRDGIIQHKEQDNELHKTRIMVLGEAVSVIEFPNQGGHAEH